MNPDSPQFSRDLLEARLTALLLGELSPAEEADVRRSLAQDPELSRLHDQIKATIPLLREALASAATPAVEPEPLRLSNDRRQKVLGGFKVIAPEELARPRQGTPRWLMAVAAAVIIFVLASLMLPNLAKAKAKAQSASVANNLRILEGAKEQYALEHNLAPGTPVSVNDLKVYLKGGTDGGEIVRPVMGENYSLSKVGEPVTAQGGNVRGTVSVNGTVLRTKGVSDRSELLAAAATAAASEARRLTEIPSASVRRTARLTEENIIARSSEIGRRKVESRGAAVRPEEAAQRMRERYGLRGPQAQAGGEAQPLAEVAPRAEGPRTAPAQGVYLPSVQEPESLGFTVQPAGEVELQVAAAGTTRGVAVPADTATRNWGDFDGDGNLDLLLSSGETRGRQLSAGDTTRFYRNSGQGTFDRGSGIGGGGGGGGLGGGIADTSIFGKQVESASAPTLGAPASSPASGTTRGIAGREISDPSAANGRWDLADKDVAQVHSVDVVGYTDRSSTAMAAMPAVIAPSAEPATEAPATRESFAEANSPAIQVEVMSSAVAAPNPDVAVAVPTAGANLAPAASAAEPLALEPLQIKLPTPAFMGTPVDLPTVAVAADRAKAPVPGDVPLLGQAFRSEQLNEAAKKGEATEQLGKPLAYGRKPAVASMTNTAATELGVEGKEVAMMRRYGLIANAEAPEPAAEKSRELLRREVREKEVAQIVENLDSVVAGVSGTAQPAAVPAQQLAKLDDELSMAKEKNVELRAQLVESDQKAAPQPASVPSLAPLTQEEERVVVSRPVAPPPTPQPEVATSANPFSTFSLNVSDVSFKLAASSLENGALPDAGSIRSEEFINAFDYHDPAPAPGMPLAFAWERARTPFAHNRDLLRLSLQTAARGREPSQPLNLVALLDNSGSMERADRVAIIREALRVLAGQLQPQDKISVVTFSRTPRLWIDGLSGAQAGELVEKVGNLTPEGGTNLEDALRLAYETAARHYLANGMNRVVLLTDGAANLGDVNPESLKQRVESNRKQGIALDCFGIGWEGYNDDLLEVLSRNGDGRYGFVNTPEEAASGFANQLAGALQVAAADVKVQVEFNPQRVTNWRQIGYAKHQLTKEQFRDNTVDAAEIGAAESGNALYTMEVNPRGEGPLGMVRARYKVPATGEYREFEWELPYQGEAVALDQASPTMRLAGSAAAFSEWLASSPFATEVAPDELLKLIAGVPEVFGADARPKKLEWMIRQAKSMAGK